VRRKGGLVLFHSHLHSGFSCLFQPPPAETFQLPEIQVIKLFPEVRLHRLSARFLRVSVCNPCACETHKPNSVGAQCEGEEKNWTCCQKTLVSNYSLPGTFYGTFGKTTCEDSVSSTVWRNDPGWSTGFLSAINSRVLHLAAYLHNFRMGDGWELCVYVSQGWGKGLKYKLLSKDGSGRMLTSINF
jgi:hypothetical protein